MARPRPASSRHRSSRRQEYRPYAAANRPCSPVGIFPGRLAGHGLPHMIAQAGIRKGGMRSPKGIADQSIQDRLQYKQAQYHRMHSERSPFIQDGAVYLAASHPSRLAQRATWRSRALKAPRPSRMESHRSRLTGRICHSSLAYSRMVRSLENLPALAVFIRHLRPKAIRS